MKMIRRVKKVRKIPRDLDDEMSILVEMELLVNGKKLML